MRQEQNQVAQPSSLSKVTRTPKKTFPFPGLRTSADGSTAVVHIETRVCSGAAAYPITPSTNMGVSFQQAVADGTKNVWGESLVFFEPESEHSAASVCEGYALAGGRVCNFTAGQGLVLMKEVLYTIAGKRLPMVFNIGARALTVHALNVHAGHDDVMGVADCGWGMLFGRNAQEAQDFCLIARKTSEDSFVPYMNIQDGFLTTHTVETVNLLEDDLIRQYMQKPSTELHNFIDVKNPVMTGTVQNQDAYMTGKVAQRVFYRPLKGNLVKNMQEFQKLTGRKYGLVEGYRLEDADYVIVGMGSYMDTAKSTVDWLRKNKKEKVGALTIFSYRPFPAEEVVAALKGAKAISVLERVDESSAPESPLARDVKSAFADALAGNPNFAKIKKIPIIQSGAGGLGGRDVRARDFVSIVENMKKGTKGNFRYCVGIQHPDALPTPAVLPDIRPKGAFSLGGHSIGGLGSVTTNKIMASVCGDLFDLYVQAFPKYGAEKKGLPTSYFLTISPLRVEYHQELEKVDFIFLSDINAFAHSNPLDAIVQGGAIFVQGNQHQVEAFLDGLSEKTLRQIKGLGLKLYYLDALAIAKEKASTADLLQRMQGIVLLGVFLKVSPFARERKLDKAGLMVSVEKVVRKYFGKRGDRVVQDNLDCIERGFEDVQEMSWERN
jgi:pyruvate-ferredoxin/flavodoxin oxidoreductase